ncbi:unnamed protein product [Meganyctiphanes norvegica]|uniref:Uncharacterized protein n=1 Tax=Meganyctiphanes norvegica TaxID=48144 RepID=A0AAV2PTU1_MEGNR
MIPITSVTSWSVNLSPKAWSMPLNWSGSIVPGVVPSKERKAAIIASSSSCSPDDLDANMLRRTVKLMGAPPSATICWKSESVPGRPISANVAARSLEVIRPSLSLSITLKPSLNSAICFWENLSKTHDSDFFAAFFFAGMMINEIYWWC